MHAPLGKHYLCLRHFVNIKFCACNGQLQIYEAKLYLLQLPTRTDLLKSLSFTIQIVQSHDYF